MMGVTQEVPAVPVLRFQLIPDQRRAVFVDEHGTRHEIKAEEERAARRQLLDMAQDVAARMNRPVRVATSDPNGVSLIAVSPTGERWQLAVEEPLQDLLSPAEEPVETADPAEETPAPAERLSAVPDVEEFPESQPAEAPESPAPVQEDTPHPAPEAAEVKTTSWITPPPLAGAAAETVSAQGETGTGDAGQPATPTRRSLRDADPGSFIRSETATEPATEGFRGFLNTVLPVLALAPAQAELLVRDMVRLVAKHYSSPRTIAVVNQKGGVGKTPTTVCLAALFGRNGGSVLAWDNNETSGSLGKRTEKGDHDACVLDVLARAGHLLSDAARAADINAFVHRQITDRYDVLRSDPDLLGTHEITAAEVDTLYAVASKFFNILLMDSGNNHRAGNWNQMIEHADQLVLPVTVNDDDVATGLETLQGLDLRGGRPASLASEAVVVVSQKARGQEKGAEATAAKFAPYVREVVIVPFDRALVSGVIRFGALQPATQLAWLRAGAAVAKGL